MTKDNQKTDKKMPTKPNTSSLRTVLENQTLFLNKDIIQEQKKD